MMTKMIREHFNLIAKAFYNAKPIKTIIKDDYDYYTALAQWNEDIEQIAYALKQTNERFDKDRFIKACKGEH